MIGDGFLKIWEAMEQSPSSMGLIYVCGKRKAFLSSQLVSVSIQSSESIFQAAAFAPSSCPHPQAISKLINIQKNQA